jgi:hypothetical protein
MPKKNIWGDVKVHKWILLALGIFLVLDGILSLYFGNSCLDKCLNNNYFGNLVRWMRAIIGVYLIYIGVRK